jgi:LPS export ABC transporter protein LptC
LLLVKRLLTLSIIVFIALAFWGLQNFDEQKDNTASNEVDSHFVDLFMHDFTLTAMNENGNPGYTLQASYFEHYNDGSNSLIEKPVIHLLQDSNSWVITAKSGEIDKDNNLIILHDDVLMQQQQTDTPVQIETSQLKINTTSQIARSDQPVNIVQGKLKLKSKGLILNNSTGVFELLASVKGNYVQAD